MKKIILKTIKFYQIFISPLFGCSCRFYPSCSDYTLETVQKQGAIKGLKKGLLRISRCHPFNKGGVDMPL